MAKFNTRTARTALSSPVVTEATPCGTTFEGAPGYARDVKSELFLLAVSNMVGEDTFYEKADARDTRFRDLVVAAAKEDPDWVAKFLPWLRAEGNMRSAPLVAAAELVRAKPDGMRTRAVVDSVLQRADEPSEILAYWLSTYGKPIPIALKRGVADAVVRLYTERSLAKYDSAERGVRFGDVVDLVTPAYHHPEVRGTWRYDLYRHALDRRHNRDNPIPESLEMLRNRAYLMAVKDAAVRRSLLTPVTLESAGMTWESLAGWLQGPMDAKAWEAIIPSMGIFALARNLRNFDQAGVSDEVAAQVSAKISSEAEVARSRMFPYRWFSAYLAAPSLRWGHALEKALGHATKNIPEFKGRTLVLVDTSASMSNAGVSARSQMTYAQIAALFGVALAVRGNAVDLHGFADGVFQHPVGPGVSVLRTVDAFCRRIGEVGHGTRIADSVRAAYRGHDRVVIISDMQTFDTWYGGDVTHSAPAHVPIYGFNLAGYQHAAMPTGSGNRHELGGMTDATFKMIPLLESARSADWPWL
jgi:hypothetical protein